jgi:hypothetical protein
MATPTYTLIDTRTLSVASGTVEFVTIDQSFRDLVLTMTGSANASSVLYLRLNGDSGSNYARVRSLGYSGGPYSDNTSTTSIDSVAQFDTNQGSFSANIMDYQATDKQTTVLIRASNKGSSETVMSVGKWANTEAVDSVVCTLSTSTWNIGTTVNLYGIAG